jgi:hypothetical protein
MMTPMDPLPVVSWSEAARSELPAKARGRRLMLDYFAARCCGTNVSIGDLHLRWIAPGQPMAEEYWPLKAPAGIEAYVQRDLVRVLEAAGGQIAMRGWGVFRRPAVDLANGAMWLDFIGACRIRSPIGH